MTSRHILEIAVEIEDQNVEERIKTIYREMAPIIVSLGNKFARHRQRMQLCSLFYVLFMIPTLLYQQRFQH